MHSIFIILEFQIINHETVHQYQVLGWAIVVRTLLQQLGAVFSASSSKFPCYWKWKFQTGFNHCWWTWHCFPLQLVAVVPGSGRVHTSLLEYCSRLDNKCDQCEE